MWANMWKIEIKGEAHKAGNVSTIVLIQLSPLNFEHCPCTRTNITNNLIPQ